MAEKKSNLAFSADITHCEELLRLAEKLGPEISVLKTHVDILADFIPAFSEELVHIARKNHFLIFEDRKFADIGNTVKHQYGGGIYRISEWADIINAHTLPGPYIISGLKEIGLKKNRGLLLLAEMSSEQNLFTHAYTEKTLAFAEAHADFVIGFIAQKKLSQAPHWLYMTPGVQLLAGGDVLGQRYITPEIAITQNQSDIIIVGRGILESKDPLARASQYKKHGWEAYLALLKKSS